MPQPFRWWEIVARSRALTGDQKVVWDVVRRYDSPKGGDGCWLSVVQIAQLAGLQPKGVESILALLTRHRLLVTERRGPRTHRWVRLPEQCYPTERPTAGELVQYAAILDGLIGTPVTTGARHPLGSLS